MLRTSVNTYIKIKCKIDMLKIINNNSSDLCL